MERPLVSAVITTYQRDTAMLLQAVESVLHQTYRPMEFIVVSDNPPESEYARAVAQALAAYPAVRLIQLQKNSGAQVARNTGIRNSSGAFVAFLDDDDLWLPEKIEKQMPLFADPAVGLVYCRGYDFVDDITKLRDYYTADGGFHTTVTFAELLVQDRIGSTSQAVVRRICFEDCGYFDEAFKARQDYDRWLSITQKYKAAGVDIPLFLHRQHEGERITTCYKKSLAAYAMLYKKYRKFYHKHPTACMRYYYRRAIILRFNHRNFLCFYNAMRAMLWDPANFIRQYRLLKSLKRKRIAAAEPDAV